jgi:hypothetical protein
MSHSAMCNSTHNGTCLWTLRSESIALCWSPMAKYMGAGIWHAGTSEGRAPMVAKQIFADLVGCFRRLN